MTAKTHPMATDDQMREIKRLAPTAVNHRLPEDMLGSRPLTRPAALMVIARLASHQTKSRELQMGPVASRKIQPVEPGQPRLTFAQLADLIPEGRYAVDSATGHNDLDFYLVQKPNKGKWAGRTFVKRIVGGDNGPYSMSNSEQFRALRQIHEAGAEEAKLRYAAETGNCSECGRLLTDEESRRTGKGPVCRNK